MPKKNKFEIGDVKEAARGNWVEIFSRFNITVPKKNSHGPCPYCGGEDRFLYDDKYENGDWLCNVCTESKNRDGFDLIGKVTGFAFSQVIEEVASTVGLQSTSNITDAMRKQWAEERKIQERINQEMELKKQQQVSRQAQGLYRNPYPGESSPYLERKRVPALPGVKIDHKGNALIPAFDEAGFMWNMQTIYPDGGKFFVADKEDQTGNKKGGRTGGCFFILGTIDLINPTILIAEGYATAASIHLATGYPVIVSFVANNLPKVGTAIRSMYPSASLVYCADDDSAKEDTGLKYANQAVAVTGGITVLPAFGNVQQLDQGHNTEQPQATFIPSDFNDLHLLRGLGEVKAQIDLAITNSIPLSPEPPNNNKPIQGQGQNENLSYAPLVVEKPLADDQGQGGGISTENDAAPESIQKFVDRYYLIEAKTDIWDNYDKIVIKKNAFSALLGQKQYKLWLEHKNVIPKTEFEYNVNAATNLTIQELLNNFVVLANSEEAWNLTERKTWLIKHIRIAYPNIFDMWFKSPDRKIIPRQNLIFDPKQEHDHDENYINIYRGLNIEVMRDQYGEQLSRPEVFEDCQGIITLINDLCDREDVAVDFLLKWLAFPLQNIGAKMATCVLMHGHIHGSGKSLMFGTIMKKIYGEYHTTVGQAQLDNQYNEWIENKLFGVFEEIVDNKKKHNVMGMIKHLITGETLYVSKKFVSGWEMNNHLNTVFLSNNTQPLPIEEKDRRFLVLNPGKDLDGMLHEKVMQEIKTNGVQAFYTYLMGLDLSDFHEHIKPPMTRAKKTMIDYSRAGFDTFYHEWINGDTKYPYTSCKSEQLYKAFGQWSRTTGEHQISMKRFIIEGKKHGIIPSDKAKHWKGARSSGQNKVIIIGEKLEKEQEQIWLGLQIEKFQDSLDGVNDVPEAKYA